MNFQRMKYVKSFLVLAIVSLLILSCDKSTPSSVFFPDMYYPVAYDPYQEAVKPYTDEVNEVPLFVNKDGQTALAPVKGTVARNKEKVLPIEFDNTPEGYEASKLVLVSPLELDSTNNKEKDLERGKKLYEQTCAACHGVGGDGQGSIVQTGAYNGVPNYADRQISVGSIHYVITYGKNAMGSYASHLTPADRWRVAQYVMSVFKKQEQVKTDVTKVEISTTENK